MTAATTTKGSSARKTARQLSALAMAPLAAGPMSPGTTQAVENTANTRGRRVGGYMRLTDV